MVELYPGNGYAVMTEKLFVKGVEITFKEANIYILDYYHQQNAIACLYNEIR